MGIVKGGGVNCSRVDEENYTWENKTGDWMRVAAFKDVWIDKVIEEETRVGMELNRRKSLSCYSQLKIAIIVLFTKASCKSYKAKDAKAWTRRHYMR